MCRWRQRRLSASVISRALLEVSMTNGTFARRSVPSSGPRPGNRRAPRGGRPRTRRRRDPPHRRAGPRASGQRMARSSGRESRNSQRRTRPPAAPASRPPRPASARPAMTSPILSRRIWGRSVTRRRRRWHSAVPGPICAAALRHRPDRCVAAGGGGAAALDGLRGLRSFGFERGVSHSFARRPSSRGSSPACWPSARWSR